MKQVNFRAHRVLALLFGLFLCMSTFAQTITVKGLVKDATGETVIGANVLEKGTTNGTITDFDGLFQLQVNRGATIVVSFVGYKTQELAAEPNMVITLADDADLLEEVVVIGYGAVKKNDLTGSVTALRPDEKNRPLATSAQDLMQGKIAGVSVTSNGGTPGGSATIRIRGGSSLHASNDPLIVIDGLAMDNIGVKGAPNALAMVNPNDIESFTVLKDASATAIYGSRGSNGVIIITTKKGRSNQAPKISYNGNVSVSKVNKTIDLLDAKEYRNFINSYYGDNSTASSLLGNADTDWNKEIFRTAISTDHNVTMAGGFKHVPYRLSVGYTDQNGTLKTSNYQRYTASMNLNPSFLDDHLTFNINGKFMYAKTSYANTGAIGAANRMDPTHPVFASGYDLFNGYFTWTDNGSALNDPNWPVTKNTNAASNPVAMLNEKSDKADSYDYMGNVEVDYKIHGFEDLRLHMNFSGDWANGKQNTIYEPWGQSNTYYGNKGYTKENKYNLIYSAYAQYYKDFKDVHHVDVMGGYEWSHNKFWGDSYYAGAYPSTNTVYPNQPYKESTSIWKQESYLVSFFGRANYSWDDRYLLTATVRRDGSSRFKEHWATFPSVAFAWKIKDENCLKYTDWVSDLKFRMGWGKTGQQDGIGNYNYFASYGVNTTNVDGRYPIKGVNDSGLLYRPNAYNENLKWETTTTYNVGFDYGFLNNRISGALDLYWRETTVLINDAYVSAGSNFRNKVSSNIGTMHNAGVEFSVTVRPIQTENWQWSITANATYNDNKIEELTGESSVVKTGGISAGTGNTVQAQAPGHPKNSFYVYQQVYGADGQPLEGVYVDRNADGQISDDDLYFYKSPDAPFTAGLSSNLQYKNWDFGFTLRANLGNYVFNDTEAGFMNMDKRFDSSFSYLQNVTHASVARGWKTYDHAVSDYWVENASFLKCDNITLGYSFDGLFKGSSYQGASGRVYATASNVFTITKYSGIDPEVYGGIDNNMYPRAFSLLLGLSLNF